jgi:hypothetical protein
MGRVRGPLAPACRRRTRSAYLHTITAMLSWLADHRGNSSVLGMLASMVFLPVM